MSCRQEHRNQDHPNQDYRNLEEYQNRLEKKEILEQLGLNPYPHSFCPTHDSETLTQLAKSGHVGNSEDAEANKTPVASVAGRMVLFRAMGKNAFCQIQDRAGRIQIMFNRDNTKINGISDDLLKESETPNALKLIEKRFDLGDIIGIEGNIFYTGKGELTIYAKDVTLLSKSLLPLPDKHAGLTDKEMRYRKRWVDLICHEHILKTFKQRSQILSLIRRHFEEINFIEVETPILGSIYGGAQARPFLTKLNALDQEMFMRISLEIPLKKLLIGGFDRVFEIGKVFRNEGIDRTHNPEFTLLEAYAAYWDYNDMMRVVETLFEKIALTLHNTTRIVFQPEGNMEPVEIDLKTPWRRMTMKESIKVYSGIDVDLLNDEEIRSILIESGLKRDEVKKASRGLLIAHLFETKVEPKLIQPHHITDHPIETTPLCKPHRDPDAKAEGLIERFESFILGKEICNSYSELNDPVLQRTLLEEQADRKAHGDEEANPLDEEFLEAMCQGMPPAGGLGIGLDRLIMLFTNSHSIRDVLFFPWMKPEHS